ncbi:MAG: flagellar basal body rod protein FlgC [Deltaproteobacteria bacterium]|nr:flagellar basal body rod protein FlgC [Deltaproteobacteria bacterium]
MDFLTALHISTTGLTAQRTTMNVIATNLANVNTTHTRDGVPYRRKIALIHSRPVNDFDAVLSDQAEALSGVRIDEIVEEMTPFRRIYEPGHPDADADGYVSYPNVNVVTETTEMMFVRRAYEANVTAISAAKKMALKALEIGR